MPVPRNSMQLDYSRWQQNLIGVLQVDISYTSQIEIGNFTVINIITTYSNIFFLLPILIYFFYSSQDENNIGRTASISK